MAMTCIAPGIMPAVSGASRSRSARGQDVHAPAGETPALQRRRRRGAGRAQSPYFKLNPLPNSGNFCLRTHNRVGW
jgi:hypothetical protein